MAFPILCFLTIVGTNIARADSGEPYGEAYIAVDRAWPAEAPPVQLLPELIAPDPEILDQLRQRLEEQELMNGPYAPGLAETLSDLARAQDASGDWVGALQSRRRALHLIRVNDGLYGEAQAPIVRAMLDGFRRRGDFAALDEFYDYFFRLYGSARPPYGDVRWRATMEYLRWQREALRRDLDGDFKGRLLRLYRQNEELLDTLTDEGAEFDWKRLRDATYSQLQNLHFIQARIEPAQQYREIFGETPRRGEIGEVDMELERLQGLQRRTQRQGRTLLEDLITRAPADDFAAVAEARLAMADWLQWQGGGREARALYMQLWQDLNREERRKQRDRWFGEPVPLPDNGAFWQPDRPASDAVRVDIVFSERGRPDVISRGGPGSTPRLDQKLRRLIRATRFRPAIRDGEFQVPTLKNQAFLVYD